MLLSTHEAIVWWEFQHGKSTSEIAEEYKPRVEFEGRGKDKREKIVGQAIPVYVLDVLKKDSKGKNPSENDRNGEKEEQTAVLNDAGYVSRVLNRARGKIEKTLRDHANSHRLDIESVQDYKGLLIGFDYQANTQVYIVFTLKEGVVVWYKHDSYAGKLCPQCPKETECRNTLDTIVAEYDIRLRPDEEELYMTQQSIAIFSKLAAKGIPRYRRREDSEGE